MDEDFGRRDREERSDRSDVGITAAAPVPGTALERAQASTLRSRQRRSRGMRLGDWERVHCRLRRLAWRSWLFPRKRHWQGMAAESRGTDEPSPRRGSCLSQALYHDGTAYSQTDCSSTLLWSSPQPLDPFDEAYTRQRIKSSCHRADKRFFQRPWKACLSLFHHASEDSLQVLCFRGNLLLRSDGCI